MICGSGGSKSRLAKAAGAEPPGQMRDEQLHAAVARSTFGRQNVQSTSCSDMFGRLLEVEMSKKCTPLWRAAKHMWKSHLEVKMYKTHHSWTTFGSWDVEKVHAVLAWSTFPSQNVQNPPGSEHFLKHVSKSKVKKWRVGSTFGRSDVVLRGRHKGFCTLPKVRKTWEFWSSFNYDHHYTTLHYTTLHSTTTTTTTSLHYTNYIALHELHYTSTTLHYITLHYANYNYTTLHYTDYITLHYMTPHWTTPHHTTLTTTTATTTTILLYTTLEYTTLHSPTLYYTTVITPHIIVIIFGGADSYTTLITNATATTLHKFHYTTTATPLHSTTTTTTAALHHTTSSSCGWGDRPGDHCNHCSHSKQHNSNHLSIHEWIRSAIRDSQQPASHRFPIFETSATALRGITGIVWWCWMEL